jgi:arylsulfatase A-like enzyme
MKTLLISLILILVLISPNFSQDKRKHKTQAPNIILILADDLGWSDIGAYGSEIETPNLDKLAKGGMRFTQCYNTSKCFPSRAALITGVYAQQCGMGRSPGSITKAAYTGEILKKAGYRTYWTGKHHSQQNPFHYGYDHYYGLRDGACNMFNPGKQRKGEPKPAQKRANRMWCIDDKEIPAYTPPKGFYTTTAFTDYAIQYLEKDKDSDKPFFLFVSYTAPHDPLMAPPQDIAKYKGKYAKGYDEIRKKRFKKQRGMGIISENVQLSPTLGIWEALSEEEKNVEERTMEVYAAMIDCMDQNIGRILKKVKELGQEDNTLVMFISDNGGSREVVKNMGNRTNPVIGEMDNWKSLGIKWANVANTPFKEYKNFSMEGGICTPFIAYWPQVIKDKGAITEHPTHFIDFLPTFMEITEASYPTEIRGEKCVPIQGESFYSVFKGLPIKRDKPLYWQWSRGKAVRKDDWKLVSHGDWELYNIKEDRVEANNLIGKHPEVAEELENLYLSWAKESGITDKKKNKKKKKI